MKTLISNITKFLFIGIILVATNGIKAQSYLGWATTTVNFREGPGTNFKVISKIPQGAQIFIISRDDDNDFLNIIDINTNIEGYVHKNYVEFGKIVPLQEKGVFQPSGTTDSYESEVEIFNNTVKTLTLTIGNIKYDFRPNQKRWLTLIPGEHNYRASAPGVIPLIGNESFNQNQKYTWEFFIVTKRN